MDQQQRQGIINATLHIVESNLKAPDSTPAIAIHLAVNALPKEDQTKIAERVVAYLKEQDMLLNQKKN